MAFFKATTMNASPGKQNAVIMGRRTWQSIPKQMKPLVNRINVVISKTLSGVEAGVYIEPDLKACMALLDSTELAATIDKTFVIGGVQLYKEVLEQSTYPVRIYCTHILQNVDCDTFFPTMEWDNLVKVSVPEVPGETQEEDEYTYKFAVYDVPTKSHLCIATDK